MAGKSCTWPPGLFPKKRLERGVEDLPIWRGMALLHKSPMKFPEILFAPG
jgi:hypothetical protein